MGALTSKPYAFTARSWELRAIETVDVLNAEGANIRVDVRGNSIMRVLPRVNYDINMEWISDLARFSYDGTQRQRLHTPAVLLDFVRRYMDSTTLLKNLGWPGIFKIYRAFLKNSMPFFIAGDFLDLETYQILYRFMGALGISQRVCTEQAVDRTGVDLINYFTCSIRFKDIELLDIGFFVGFNPRLETPLLNIRFRKAVLQRCLKIFVIGFRAELNFKVISLGNNLNSFVKLVEGKHPITKLLRVAKHPAFFFGRAAKKRVDFLALFEVSRIVFGRFLCSKLLTLNVMIVNNSTINAAYAGMSNCSLTYIKELKPSFLHIMNVDNIWLPPTGIFTVYQGTHYDVNASKAKLIFPAAGCFERSGFFVNMEGLFQRTAVAVAAPTSAIKSDWRIIKALAAYLGRSISCTELRASPLNFLPKTSSISLALFKLVVNPANKWYYKFYVKGFVSVGYSLNLGNSITRNSSTLALSANIFGINRNNFIND